MTDDELRNKVAQFLEDSDIYLDKFAEERNVMHENDVITAIVVNVDVLYRILDEYVRDKIVDEFVKYSANE